MKLPGLFRYALAAAALAGCAYSVVLARAELLFRRDTRETVAAAVRLVPANSVYLTRLAGWDAARRMQLLQRAVGVNPFDAEAWIAIGFQHELRDRDPLAAERDYLAAEHVDRMFLPKWTLTNFYLRCGDRGRFFRWASAAAAITPYAAGPIFDEMWLMDPDARRVAAAVPDRPTTLAQYILFLSNVHQYDAVPDVVARLVRVAPPAYGNGWNDIVGPVEDQLAATDPSAALKSWNALHAGGWVPEAVPTIGTPVTNGDFRAPFLGHGFDWAAVDVEGVEIEQNTGTPNVGFTFSGNEPEYTPLFRQWIALRPGARYRMQWKSSGLSLEGFGDTRVPRDFDSGVHWHLYCGPVHLVSPDATEAGEHTWEFDYRGQSQGAYLVLEYNRPLGETRLTGNFALQSVSMTPL